MSAISDSGAEDSKRLHGQFFTVTNPFNMDPFHKWLKAIPAFRELVLLEPFAGANNIVSMLSDLGYSNSWSCFDIEPVNDERNASGVEVQQRDSLSNYPVGFEVAITNPPYLAKNSATRRGLSFPASQYDDLYKISLEVMLENTPYVAAIIPESFVTQRLFHQRLHSVISLTCEMFEDTEVPVCLALFVPEASKEDPSDFAIYAENRFIGAYQSLRECLAGVEGPGLPWKFNDPSGAIGLQAIDNQKCASIGFVLGSSIPGSQIKESSRSVTRISGPVPDDKVGILIQEANALLKLRRDQTKDAFMTSFKGLRKDGRYRRRLDFAQARELLNLAARKVGLL